MRLAIIGSGNVGKALAAAARGAGHSVTLASAHPEHAEEAARATGAEAAPSAPEAVRDAEVVILAIPSDSVAPVLSEVGAGLSGKIVIDATNRMNPSDPASALDGTSNAEKIQAKAPEAQVFKAFNTALAARQADPNVDGKRADGYVAGNDLAAKAKVLELVDSIGFHPVDAGDLYMARVLEGMALLNMMLQVRTGGSWQSAWQLAEPSSQN